MMTTTTFAPTMPRDTLVVDTYNWDTVFAISYPRANQAVADSWKTQPASVTNFDSASEGFEIKGVFAPWLLAPGGSGDLANLNCPIQSGSYTTPGTNYDLTG